MVQRRAETKKAVEHGMPARSAVHVSRQFVVGPARTSGPTSSHQHQLHAVNPLFGRLFAAWTTVTCMLCLICASNPTNRAIYSKWKAAQGRLVG